MRFIYSALFYLLVPFIIIRLFWRGYRQRWLERFAYHSSNIPQGGIWIHAVSMGEVQAAVPLIKALISKFPQYCILVTTMTPTGSQRVQEVFGKQVSHVYLPYDLPGAMGRFLNKIQPRLLIIMETELWPNLLYSCKKRQIPVILANARLSANSAAGYQRINGLVRQIFSGITAVAAQTSLDAARFIELGMAARKVHITGSIKFDADNLSVDDQFHIQRRVWIAASTHEGEEDIVLEAFAELKIHFKDLLLILVPRHPERFNKVAAKCENTKFITSRRSEEGKINLNTDIYLGDTMGELPLLYAASDVAFVGGSLVAVGGHNSLEAAALGLPVIMGPHVFECEAIFKSLLEAEAATQVNNRAQLILAVTMYFSNDQLKTQTGENGRLFVKKNQGALEALLNIIKNYE
ncbi:lipid IV(A) 3-deoxy-D-manno-octulosonic acid transferase [Candidatus Marithrix sp. Canyon 246]|uniref:lipid IV(A) 3-deoxy-D-manno-octulosonic acid transferase n=1 Tax=Candidatus Marithrix sp. Canyon 246 TaxID=1827136 RepID=UPI00084A2993|nr:lipid IV(A) 3-deoxy-D-manno-octulosonic acid transferase [Candidatus Marithrix sp. Canyon 246]